MKIPKAFLALALVLLMATAGWNPAPASASSSQTSLTPREKALHVLNRLGFGPRPGDVDRLLEMGIPAYIDAQLSPERIPDGAVAEKLRGFATLEMSTSELMETFERPIREARRKRNREAAKNGGTGETAEAALQKAREMIPPERRPRRIIEELSVARVLRAAYSERQLNEVLVDFWMNHFNVFAGKGLDRVFVTSFERDVVRPRIYGKFEDLVLATAKSPAMLFYLDNARSVADPENRPAGANPESFSRRRKVAEKNPEALPNMPSGLNENYARELMELHTLGVDGGYAQKDVTELARLLTGWSIRRPREGEGFIFRTGLHDAGSKTILGTTFPAGGAIEEGEKMIRVLSRHPSTARHISRKLCQKLVADDPPRALVERVARRFLATQGDLRETVRAVVTSPEFGQPSFYRVKVKSPFEYVVSAVRAMGGSTDGRALARQIGEMGEPLYLCQPPTGYSDEASAWVNSGALLARMNFALALAAGQLPGTSAPLGRLLSDSDAATAEKSVERLGRALVGTDLSFETRETIRKRVAGESAGAGYGPQGVPLIAGLILGSPEFQRQ